MTFFKQGSTDVTSLDQHKVIESVREMQKYGHGVAYDTTFDSDNRYMRAQVTHYLTCRACAHARRMREAMAKKATGFKQFRHVLPKFQVEPSWQEKIDENKSTFVGLGPAELATEFAKEKERKSALEEKIKVQNTILEALSQLLVDNLEDSDIQALQTKTGESVYLSDEPFSSVQDRALVYAYIKKTKQTNLLTVHHQTLNAINKDLFVSGKQLVPGTTLFIKTRARCRSARKGFDDGE